MDWGVWMGVVVCRCDDWEGGDGVLQVFAGMAGVRVMMWSWVKGGSKWGSGII